MFPDGWVDAVAVVGQCGAGEVEGAAIDCGDDFYGVGVVDVVRSAKNFECRDLC